MLGGRIPAGPALKFQTALEYSGGRDVSSRQGRQRVARGLFVP